MVEASVQTRAVVREEEQGYTTREHEGGEEFVRRRRTSAVGTHDESSSAHLATRRQLGATAAAFALVGAEAQANPSSKASGFKKLMLTMDNSVVSM